MGERERNVNNDTCTVVLLSVWVCGAVGENCFFNPSALYGSVENYGSVPIKGGYLGYTWSGKAGETIPNFSGFSTVLLVGPWSSTAITEKTLEITIGGGGSRASRYDYAVHNCRCLAVHRHQWADAVFTQTFYNGSR